MSQILTPSSKSAGIAGGVFWAMIWAAIGHLDDIAELLRLPRRFFSSRRILAWVNDHKGVSIVCTELVNYGIHGVKDSTGVTFAIGGTVCNILFVFCVLPILNLVKGKTWLYGGR